MTERQPGSDPIGELQRWLVRSGARSVSRELGDQVRTVLGSSTHGDVWESATADHEAPECQWCPICRARRRLRESGPGLSSAVAAAGDAVSVVLQDAVAAFEAAGGRGGTAGPAPGRRAGHRGVWDEATEEPPAAGYGRGDRRASPPTPRLVRTRQPGHEPAQGRLRRPSWEAAGAAGHRLSRAQRPGRRNHRAEPGAARRRNQRLSRAADGWTRPRPVGPVGPHREPFTHPAGEQNPTYVDRALARRSGSRGIVKCDSHSAVYQRAARL